MGNKIGRMANPARAWPPPSASRDSARGSPAKSEWLMALPGDKNTHLSATRQFLEQPA